MAKPEFPYRYITGLQPKAQQEIWRDLEYLATAIGDISAPFIVVADDGTGDFTSIKDAIESVATSDTAGTFAIYVKPHSVEGTAYDDSGLGEVDIGGGVADLRIYLFGPNVGPNGRNCFVNTGLRAGVQWQFDSLSFDPGGGGATTGAIELVIENLDLLPTAAVLTEISPSATNAIMLKNCHVAGAVSNVAGGFDSLVMYDTTVTSAVLNISGSHSTGMVSTGCWLKAGWVGATATTVVSDQFIIEDSIVRGQVTTTISNDGSSTLDGRISVCRNIFTAASTAVYTLNLPNALASYAWQDNIDDSGGGTGLVSWVLSGSGQGPRVVFSGNSTPRWSIEINYSAGTTACYISGIYRKVTIASSLDNCVLDVVIDMQGTAGLTGVDLAGDGCIVNMGIARAGASSVGLNVSGNRNIINGGFENCTTPYTNTGTGNIINGAASGSGTPVTTADFRHSFIPGPDYGDTRRIRHMLVSATPPTDDQVLAWNDTTKKLEWITPSTTDAAAIHTGDSAGPWFAGTYPSPQDGPDFTQAFLREAPDGNARRLRHIPISATPPTDDQVPAYNSSTGQIEWVTPGASSATADHMMALNAMSFAARGGRSNLDRKHVPFLVVAADGSGDYTSIKSAIDALPANSAVANTLSGVIYVKKNVTGGYTDGASTVALTDKSVVLIGNAQPGPIGVVTDSVMQLPKWTFGGFTQTGSSAKIYIYGMQIVATALFTSTLFNARLEQCRIDGLTNAAASQFIELRNCYVGSSMFLAAHTPASTLVDSCSLQAGWSAASLTNTLSGSTAQFRIINSLIKGQVTTTLAADNLAGSGQVIEFINNQISNNASRTWTFSAMGGEGRYTWIGNTRSEGQTTLLTIATSGSRSSAATWSGNNLPYTDITDTRTNTGAGLYMDGRYRCISSTVPNAIGTVHCDLRGSSTVTALTLNSGAVGGVWLVNVAVGTSTTGFSIASGANLNHITMGNLGALATRGTDSGSQNIINDIGIGVTKPQYTNDLTHQFLSGV